MKSPATCSWRNFFDPYAREYANGNSRFDLIDLMRMTRALRPDGIEWANRDDGTPSFRSRIWLPPTGWTPAGHMTPWPMWKPHWAWQGGLWNSNPGFGKMGTGTAAKTHRRRGCSKKTSAAASQLGAFPASTCGTAPILPLAPPSRLFRSVDCLESERFTGTVRGTDRRTTG